MAGRKNNSIGATSPFLIFIAIGAIAMLLFADNLESAYAYSFTQMGDAVDELGGLALVGDYVYTGTDVNAVRVYNRDTGAFVQAVSSCTGCSNAAIVYNQRVYFLGTSTLYEIDRTSGGVFVISRSVTTTSQCYGNQASLDTDTGVLYCGRASTNDDIRGFDLDTMTMTYDSASLNAGGNPCNDPQFPMVNTIDGWYAVHCPSGTAVTNVYALESETVLHSLLMATLATGRQGSAILPATDTILLCPDFCDMFTYTVAGGFVTVEANIAGTSGHGDTAIADASGSRFIMWEAGGETMGAIDAVSGVFLWDVQTDCTLGGNEQGMFLYSSSLMYFDCGVNGGGNDFYYEFDLTGLGVGSEGSTGGTVIPFECVTIEVNNSTSFEVCDDDGDGILDWEWSDLPSVGTDAAEAIPGFLQIFGLNEDAANLVAAILIHVLVIFGTAGMFYFKTHVSPPFFIWVALLIFGGGLSAAIGVMPLLYFFVEIALTVGAVAALVKTGVIGS